jgi:hypothetical protein
MTKHGSVEVLWGNPNFDPARRYLRPFGYTPEAAKREYEAGSPYFEWKYAESVGRPKQYEEAFRAHLRDHVQYRDRVRVRILRDAATAADAFGVRIRHLKAGQVASLARHIAADWIKQGICEDYKREDRARAEEWRRWRNGRNNLLKTRILKAVKTSTDGLHVRELQPGQIVRLARPQVEEWVRAGVCEEYHHE